MWLDLDHSPCTTALIAPLNASEILLAFLWTWQFPKEPTDTFGASYCLLINTETPRSMKGTRVHITFPLRWGTFLNKRFNILSNQLQRFAIFVINGLFRVSFYFTFITTASRGKALKTRHTSKQNNNLCRFFHWQSNVHLSTVTLFLVALSKWRYLCSELQIWQFWMPLCEIFQRKKMWER